MAWTRLSVNETLGISGIFDEIRRYFPTIQEIYVSRSQTSCEVFIDVREKDYGVWEWNEEVVSDDQKSI